MSRHGIRFGAPACVRCGRPSFECLRRHDFEQRSDSFASRHSCTAAASKTVRSVVANCPRRALTLRVDRAVFDESVMILFMVGSIGRFIRGLFGGGKPLPTSLALMVGTAGNAAGVQEHKLRRAMKAASEPEQIVSGQPRDVIGGEVPLVLDVPAADSEIVPESSESPPIVAEAPSAAFELEVAVADASVDEPEVEAAPTESPAEEPENAMAEAPVTAPDVPAMALDGLVATFEDLVAETVEEAPFEPLVLQAEDESEITVKKASKKKAAEKKTPKKRAARKRKEAAATPTDDLDDDAAPVEGPASFEGTVEASAP